MSKIIMVTGGARSGKSDFAESLCKNQSERVTYIATSIPFDDGMKDRVKNHRLKRPSNWKTHEAYKDIYKDIKDISKNSDVSILDCITLLVNNLMFDFNIDFDTCSMEKINEVQDYILNQIEKLIYEIKESNLYFVFVTNEIGLGVVPSNKLTRIYMDIAGKVNQKLASLADEVYFVVSSIPMKIKG